MEKHDKRIIAKKNFRFNNDPYIKEQHTKINNKLIPFNLDVLIRKLGIKSRDGNWINSNLLNINLNQLNFKSIYSKQILRSNFKIIQKAIDK